MKITVSRLKQIIKEELEAIHGLEKTQGSAGIAAGPASIKSLIKKLIKAPSDIWLEPATAGDLKSVPFEVWIALVNVIGAHWTRVSRNFHGYGSPACISEECKRFDAIFAKKATDIDVVYNELDDALNEGNRAVKKWLVTRGNSRRLKSAVKKFMDYIPPGMPEDLPKSIEESPIWLAIAIEPADGDDL